MFEMLEFIERKRDGFPHTTDDLAAFVEAVRDDLVPDYQIAAWLMAAFLRGLNREELSAFTRALAHSGDVVKFADGSERGIRVTVDKHSTGGVGDKTTLVVAPLVASCGVEVAKLSGRGLGFTGGTVDKLESIPGMDMHLSSDRFARQVREIGMAISGHSLALAPAEGRFYALRDVTGTVPSLPLIASSIVSKKISGGGDAYVFDVKCGRGAFMQTLPEAESLSNALVDLSGALGRRSVCLISDMEQPLGEWVGNSLEVFEAIEVLSARGPADTRVLCIALAAEMLLLGRAAEDETSAFDMATKALDDGRALGKFAEVVAAQGGDASVCEAPRRVLAIAAHEKTFLSPRDGFVEKVDARAVGCAVRALGGGRFCKSDVIDPSVGIRIVKKIGAPVQRGESLAEIRYNDESRLHDAMRWMEEVFSVGGERVLPRSVLLGRIG